MKHFFLSLCILISPVLMYPQYFHADSTFSENGWNRVVHDDLQQAYDAALQADGKLILSGRDGGFHAGLLRFQSDGTVDSSFGTDGFAVGFLSSSVMNNGRRVLVQPDGKIITIGQEYVIYGPTGKDIAVFRFLENGTPDPDFGIDGKATIDYGYVDETPGNMQLQPDGKILIAMEIYIPYERFTLIGRMNSDGTKDLSFGDNGFILLTDVKADDNEQSFILQPDGKILFAGISPTADDDFVTDILVYRLNEDGSIDSGFADGGSKRIDFYNGFERLNCMHLTQNNIFLLVGGCGDSYAITLHKLNMDGSFDTTFGTEGTLTKFSAELPVGGYDYMTTDAEGNLLFAGSNDGDLCAMRLKNDGEVDTTFSETGSVCISMQPDAIAGPLVLQPDGDILLTGHATSGLGDFVAARITTEYLPSVTTGIISLTSMQENNLLVYPNPLSDGILNIQATVEINTLELISINGEIIKRVDDIDALYFSTDLNEIENGMYILKAYCVDSIQTQIILIERTN